MKLQLHDFINSKLRSLVSSESDKPSLWIFGYGSLIWNPGFEYETEMKARLRGYSRRFYQGNTTFRGTPSKPGRVVNLIDDQQSECYGLAFKVQGWKQVFDALDHLYVREVENGYLFQPISIELLDSNETVQALTCIASQANPLFMPPPEHPLAPKSDETSTKLMAFEIATAAGTAGANYEYLSKLANCMRQTFPQIWDEHLFTLEHHALQFLNFLGDTKPVDVGNVQVEAVQAS